MPELPEVETVKNQLIDANLCNLTIVDASFFWPNTLKGCDIPSFKSKVIGQKITSISRRGKHLLFSMPNQTLIVHLRMSGQFLIRTTPVETIKYERAVLQFENLYLYFQDTRKFGTWTLTTNAQKTLEHLGVEPMSASFTLKKLEELCKKRNKPLKAFLLDQTQIAGLGNIYVDESLWRAKLLPTRLTYSLLPEQIKALHQAIITVLKEAIENNGSSLGKGKTNFKTIEGISGKYQHQFNVYGKESQPCPNCKTPLLKIRFQQRGTHYCPICQK